MSDSDNVRNLGWLTCFGRRCHQITDSVMIFPLFHLVVPNKLWSQWLFHSNLSRRLSKPPGKYLRFWICRHLACLNNTNIRNTSHTCNCGTYRKCESQAKPWQGKNGDTKTGLCPGWQKGVSLSLPYQHDASWEIF